MRCFKLLAASVVLFALVGLTQAQTTTVFFTTFGFDADGQWQSDLYPMPNPETAEAKVIAIGGQVTGEFTPKTSTSDYFPAGLAYMARKCSLHKMPTDDKGPEKVLVWYKKGQDPGRGRHKLGAFRPADGPLLDGYFTMAHAIGSPWDGLTVVLLGEGDELVALGCIECGNTWDVIPELSADATLMNDSCPQCGAEGITADTFTTE